MLITTTLFKKHILQGKKLAKSSNIYQVTSSQLKKQNKNVSNKPETLNHTIKLLKRKKFHQKSKLLKRRKLHQKSKIFVHQLKLMPLTTALMIFLVSQSSSKGIKSKFKLCLKPNLWSWLCSTLACTPVHRAESLHQSLQSCIRKWMKTSKSLKSYFLVVIVVSINLTSTTRKCHGRLCHGKTHDWKQSLKSSKWKVSPSL